ncbi:hypothetical protein GGS23DRAFT_267951 [Durotheca rogersii]|uniref:uncharacterized protein n=1 Tax=Durotheca rogersii TaxID=419775 RepID=UPI00221F1798|nr:uncharacterized protein GGS23DRAFT_267951 [Durotheca rogersii]KAI5859730.1 hypothetical protein GGS23DRAFT_267951 [Durotheca rogersii]
MAGLTPDLSLLNSAFFNIYHDAPGNTGSPALPSGRCNFVDLNHGANGPRCGCRRFWSRRTLSARTGRGSMSGTSPVFANGFLHGGSGGLADDDAWCMCSHHACFHDDARDGQTPTAVVPPPDMVSNGQENERPKTSREPLTPVPDPSFKVPGFVESSMDMFNESLFPNRPTGRDGASQTGSAVPAPEPSIPDTLAWANFIQSEPDDVGLLPPIPSQCLMSSQPSSTTSSARVSYLRPFAGKGLQTFSSVRTKLGEPPLGQDDETEQEEDAVASGVDHQSVDDGQTVTNTPRSCRHGDATERPGLSSPAPHQDALQQLSDVVQAHDQRLDRLENPSISTAGYDGCDDKHDHADLRITELESRVEEVEKMLNDTPSQVSAYHPARRPDVNASMSSAVSVSTSGTEYVLSRTELYSQLQALKSQLDHLQGLSPFPSPTRPWDVEVVFLPFPLKGIWMDSTYFAGQHPLDAGANIEADQWTQLPSSSSALDPQSPDGDWAGPEVESEWLLPRACAPGRVIQQRLRSRGLVKNVTICGPDARSVHHAMNDAFGTLFRTFSRMQANVHHGSTQHHRVAKFLGLQSAWVPLRKIRSDPKLHFLSPPEMVTPVTWDVSFLRASVVMKVGGAQRLYITHPEAYLQDQDAYLNGWNWQRLRELSRVYADSQSSQEVPEADAMEECWLRNDNLDETSAVAFPPPGSRQPAQVNWRTVSMSPSRHMSASVTAVPLSFATSRSAARNRTKSPAAVTFKERKGSRPPNIRTASMPPIVPHVVSQAQAKRRVTPVVRPAERRVAAQVRPPMPHVAALAKRRGTRSPSARPRNTPRWSTASPTPMPEAFPPRGSTPFYATPHSNAPFIDTRSNRGVVTADDDPDSGGSGSGADQHGGDEEDMEEDDSDDGGDDNNNSDYADSPMLDFAHVDDPLESWQDRQLPGGPEDEAWPGIEDEENRNAEIGIDIHEDDDAMTDADGFETESQKSSVPSEYPSTHRAWTGAEEGGFRVYEDANNAPISVVK